MRVTISIILLGLVLSIIGCESSYYDKSYTFSNVWRYDDPRSFNFEIKDTNEVFDMILTVDHTDHFPYQNLYLKTQTTFPSDTTLEQSLSLEMANEAGYWFGECSGENCELSVPIQSNVRFPEIGKYSLSLEQYTRTDSLIGIRGINLRLSSINPTN